LFGGSLIGKDGIFLVGCKTALDRAGPDSCIFIPAYFKAAFF